MNGLSRAIRNIWGHGDDEYADDETDFHEENDVPQNPNSRPSSASNYAESQDARPNYGGGSGSGGSGSGGSFSGGSGVRRLRSVAPSPLRAREKNIYTLRPKSQEDAAIAADALKAGDAVIINLEEVERAKAVRIIDFMSGVCYGLEGQGHAMKLGDLIFLYTPPEFEICSDETDYGENPDFFFKDVESTPSVPARATSSTQSANGPSSGAPSQSGLSSPTAHVQASATASQPLPQQSFSPQSYASGERRPWER